MDFLGGMFKIINIVLFSLERIRWNQDPPEITLDVIIIKEY